MHSGWSVSNLEGVRVGFVCCPKYKQWQHMRPFVLLILVVPVHLSLEILNYMRKRWREKRYGRGRDIVMGEAIEETGAREISREKEEWWKDLLYKIVFK